MWIIPQSSFSSSRIPGRIVEANDAAVKYYGWSHEQIRQMKIQDINTLPPEDVRKEIEMARTKERTHFEFRHRRADGSIRDVEVFSGTIDTKREKTPPFHCS